MNTVELQQYLPAALSLTTNILLAFVILLVGLWFAGKVNKLIVGIGKKHLQLDETLFRLLGSIARYIILAFVIIAVLNRFGVQTASIVALLGAAGVAVGLALQGILSNLAAGVMLLVSRPYKVGDFIDAARQVIDQVLAAHPHILETPAPFVEVETLNDSSVDFLVRPFCQGEHYFNVLYSVPEKIKKALDANNIEIPFPHRKVIVVNESA